LALLRVVPLDKTSPVFFLRTLYKFLFGSFRMEYGMVYKYVYEKNVGQETSALRHLDQKAPYSNDLPS